MSNLHNHSYLLLELFKRAQEGMIITDDRSQIIACNNAFCQITGYTEEELIGKNPNILSSGRQDKSFYKHMWGKIKEDGFWEGEVWNRKKDGSFYAELLTVSKVVVPGTENVHYLGMMSDITERKEHHSSLEKLAHYDSLTGLPNRYLLEDRFEQAVAKANRSHEMFAICFLDLDDFKPVNDMYGHNVGDQLLIEISKRIKSILRQEDTVCRYGGDEFVIILTGIHKRSDCDEILQKLLGVVEDPYELVDDEIRVGVSIGYTIYPFDKGSLDALIEHADQTLYQVKKSGKSDILMYGESKKLKDNNICFFSHTALMSAIDDGQLELFFQPKIDMSCGEIIGFEGLIRWNHPEKGLLSPVEFLPSINETYVEIYLGEYVIREALKSLSDWHEHGLKLCVSVNLSAFQIAKDNFLKSIEDIFQDFQNLDLSCFQIEILESHSLDDLTSIKSVITKCQDYFGVSMALDDFGTGYSSLSHIRNLPIHTVKIDQSFVRNMLNDPDDYKIVESVISLANAFNIDVIAEGVESIKHAQVLICMGCKFVQGYAFSRPMPADSVLGWAYNFNLNYQIIVDVELFNNQHNSNLRLLAHFVEIEFESFVSCVESDGVFLNINSPAANSTKTHGNSWLKRAKSMHLIDKDVLGFLEQNYLSFEKTLCNTTLLYQCGDNESAMNNYVQLENQFNDLVNSIYGCMN